MAAAMASCRVSASLQRALLLHQGGGARRTRRESSASSARWTIGRDRSAFVSPQFVSVPLVSQVRDFALLEQSPGIRVLDCAFSENFEYECNCSIRS